MDKNKKKLFEAFEKVCGIKLLKEQEFIIGEVEKIKDYLLSKLVFKDIDLNDGTTIIKDKEFYFNINNKEYNGSISMKIETTFNQDSGTDFAPPTSDRTIENIEVLKLNIFDEEKSIIVFDNENQNHLDFINQLEKEIEII